MSISLAVYIWLCISANGLLAFEDYGSIRKAIPSEIKWMIGSRLTSLSCVSLLSSWDVSKFEIHMY